MATRIPIVVDLDGTLTPADTLVESVVKLARKSPLNLLRMIAWLPRGKAGFKHAIAAEVSIACKSLPYQDQLLAYLRSEKEKGARIILATAANRSIADGIARHLGLFDKVLASDDRINLKGENKLAAIRAEIGDRFIYAGNGVADLPIWNAAEAAIMVGVDARTAASVRRRTRIAGEYPKQTPAFPLWLRALRIHQWLKNLLLFVPLLAAFSFADTEKLALMALAFFSFSLAASATYVANDLWDLENDRAHSRKRFRPFASGNLPIAQGVAAAGIALTIALVAASFVSMAFLLMVLLYLAVTTLYSWVLKEYVLIDVLTLSVLYTLRILAGSVAIGIMASSWLLAFSVFVFFSLSLVKRCAELVLLETIGAEASSGRDYRVTDLAVLWPLGAGSALASVVVFGLFINAPETLDRYAAPQLLWVTEIGLIYWLSRLWIKTSRGEMHDDPVVYAITDRGSRVTLLGMIAFVILAHYLSWETMLGMLR